MPKYPTRTHRTRGSTPNDLIFISDSDDESCYPPASNYGSNYGYSAASPLSTLCSIDDVVNGTQIHRVRTYGPSTPPPASAPASPFLYGTAPAQHHPSPAQHHPMPARTPPQVAPGIPVLDPIDPIARMAGIHEEKL